MSISQLNGPEGPPDSAVQNRLTAAAMVLATLFFSGTFSLQLHAQARDPRKFVETFGYLEVAIVVGTVLTIVTATCLLACQQCIASDRAWYKSKRAWFTVATVAQYLSISQAMSAGLTELVFGVRHTFDAALLAQMLALVASVLWVVLLFVAPVHTIKSWWPHFAVGERFAVTAIYVLALGFVLLANAVIYMIQDGATESVWSLLQAVGKQLIQPMMWTTSWAKPLAN